MSCLEHLQARRTCSWKEGRRGRSYRGVYHRLATQEEVASSANEAAWGGRKAWPRFGKWMQSAMTVESRSWRENVGESRRPRLGADQHPSINTWLVIAQIGVQERARARGGCSGEVPAGEEKGRNGAMLERQSF